MLVRAGSTIVAPVGTSPAQDVSIREFADRYASAWNRCDTDTMGALITEDIVWADPALPEPARGIQAVLEFMRSSFRAFPDLRFGEPDRPALAVSGDEVLGLGA